MYLITIPILKNITLLYFSLHPEEKFHWAESFWSEIMLVFFMLRQKKTHTLSPDVSRKSAIFWFLRKAHKLFGKCSLLRAYRGTLKFKNPARKYMILAPETQWLEWMFLKNIFGRIFESPKRWVSPPNCKPNKLTQLYARIFPRLFWIYFFDVHYFGLFSFL